MGDYWTWAHGLAGVLIFWWGHRLGRREAREAARQLAGVVAQRDDEIASLRRLNGFLAARGCDVDEPVNKA